MNEKQLKEYLSVDCIDNLIKEHKLLTVLYIAFTILFLDVHFFVTSLYEANETLVFSVMIVMTALIILLYYATAAECLKSMF